MPFPLVIPDNPLISYAIIALGAWVVWSRFLAPMFDGDNDYLYREKRYVPEKVKSIGMEKEYMKMKQQKKSRGLMAYIRGK